MNTPFHHNAFELVREHEIESLNLSAQEYRHIKTGASHFHLKADVDENVFLVALRTVPTDSTGVAHILEHTALCGSEKYPVRDPFFMMIRRSLNTFMNAFTSSDWTAYPFASENKKDFNNLLDVYLDAVFFSRLDELDFLQEGHRLDFEEEGNKESDLVYKGVVFNEMKGAMSSPTSRLWQDFTASLFPSVTYHFNSGGEPENITDLSYEELKEFYRVHYHPSNSVFMTFGNIPVHELQEKFEKQALQRFEKLDKKIEVNLEKRFQTPQVIETTYALDEPDSSDKTHVILGWLLGESIDLESQLEAHLMSNVLLDNSASPLRKALEKTDLGLTPSPLCGLEDSNREMAFVCGLEGCNKDNSGDIEQLILSTLKKISEDGVEQEKVEAVLHQLELHQREIGGDSYPYGLQLILSCLSAAVHRGDPIAVLNLDEVLGSIREKIKDPNYIKGLIKKLLLDNQHRVTLSMVPDSTKSAEMTQAEKAKLAQIKSSLTDSDKEQIIELAEKLKARQEQHDDPGVLPKVDLSDVPADLKTKSSLKPINSKPVTAYKEGTNGLVYEQLIVPIPELTDEEVSLLPLYSHMLTELGAGDSDFLTMQGLQSQFTGGLHAWNSMRADLHDQSSINGCLVLSGKALQRNASKLNELMLKTWSECRFDEHDRILDLLGYLRARKEQSVTGSGHSLAMTAAASHWSVGAQLTHHMTGLAGIKSIKSSHDSISSDNQALREFADKLASLHQKISTNKSQLLFVSDEIDDRLHTMVSAWDSHLGDQVGSPLSITSSNPQNQFWSTNTQVNFCSKAYSTVPAGHQDAPALAVLGGVLRNEFLHRSIREQGGAYGGGAGHDSSNGVFRFYSYRDPRLEETLGDFDKSIQWALEDNISDRALEEAVLGVISSLDKPGSPAGDAKGDFYNQLFGRTYEVRKVYREGVLSVTKDKLKEVVDTYLNNKPASTAVVTNKEGVAQSAESIGAEVINL